MAKEDQENKIEFLPSTVLVNRLPYDLNYLSWGIKVEKILNASHPIDPAYERWQRVRHPYGLTGFEGYFVGSNMSAQQIAQAIAEIGKTVISHFPRERRKVFWDTLTGEKPNLGAMLVCSQEFGAILGRLRAQASINNQAREFHDDLVARCTLPIEYQVESSGITQKIVLPQINRSPSEIETPVLAKEAYDPSHPYGLMSLIGRLGHPTVRILFANMPQQDQMRLMYPHY